MPRLPHTVRLRPLLLTAALAALIPGACTTAPRPAPPPPPQAVEVHAGQYEATFNATVEALRGSGFRIDHADYRFGVITTAPEGSPTVFEPWKTGNTTHRTRVLSTLNDVRRIVTVSFTTNVTPDSTANALTPLPAHPTAARHMSVSVHMEQRDAPGRRLNGRADGRVFTDPAQLRSADPDDLPNPWVAIGRDPGLESELQRRILARLKADSTADSTVD